MEEASQMEKENPRGWSRGPRKDKRLQALKMHKKPRNYAAFGWERLPRSTALQTQAVLLCLQTRPSEHALLQLLG